MDEVSPTEGSRSLYVEVGVRLTRADPLDHLDAAALAAVDGRQRQRPVEGVAARGVGVAVALEAPHLAAGCKEEAECGDVATTATPFLTHALRDGLGVAEAEEDDDERRDAGRRTQVGEEPRAAGAAAAEDAAGGAAVAIGRRRRRRRRRRRSGPGSRRHLPASLSGKAFVRRRDGVSLRGPSQVEDSLAPIFFIQSREEAPR